jgi:hypothetical protein
MSEIQKIIEEDTLGPKPKYITLTTAVPTYSMKPGDTCLIFTSEVADASGIVYLPSKAEAVGRFYYICAPTGAAGGDISVYDKEAGSEISTYGDMDADDDHAIFFTDGRLWRTVFDGVA